MARFARNSALRTVLVAWVALPMPSLAAVAHPWIESRDVGKSLESVGRLIEETDGDLVGAGSSQVDYEGSEIVEPVMQVLDLRSRNALLIPLKSPPESSLLTPSPEGWAKAPGKPALVAAATGGASGAATSISRDATTIVGYLDNGFFAPYHAFRWTEATGTIDLGTIDPPSNASRSSFARDVNSDGSVIVGFSSTDGFWEHAFRWTKTGGMADLGTGAGPGSEFGSRAFGVSADGGVVVGESAFPDVSRAAFRWTQADGFLNLGSETRAALAVNADGSVAAGLGRVTAFRWSASGGTQFLGALPGHSASVAMGVSDDGAIVVGISTSGLVDTFGVGGAVRYEPTLSRAFYWTETGGIRDLTELLATAGVDMTGKALVGAVGISPDGKWISAVTTRPDPEFPDLFVDKIPVLVSLTESLPPPSRLTNLSTRGPALAGDRVLIPGFVISGNTDKRLLIRTVGPTLSGFGITGPLADPIMTLKRTIDNSAINVAANNDWGANANAAEIVAATVALGAFDLPADSADAALLVDLGPGQYSVVAEGAGGGTGVAIVELYDGDATPGGSRMANISTRGFVGTGESIMIPGFVVSSESSLLLLVRAVGPTLGDYGVTDALGDPVLNIHRDNGDGTTTIVASNDNWGSPATAPDIIAAAATAGAFELISGSKDAALVLRALPGVYTVQANGVNGATGVALVEIYALE